MKQTTLGSSIRTLRIQNNMTQVQLADILGVTDKAVSKWERDLSYPDLLLFPKLADVLGTTVDSLMRECKEEYRQPKLLQTFEMSNDIRLPLHIILGFVEIIRNNHDDPEMLQRYLDVIRISGEYVITLINRIQKDKVRSTELNESPKGNLGEIDELNKYLEKYLSSGQEHLYNAMFPGKRVLVAEDMAINREIASEILKQTGAQTEFAEDGLMCLQMVEAAPAGYYDMILMDIMMPNMDGIEATRRIRQLKDPVKASTPIIAITTNVSEKDRNAAIDAGMDAFEEKPVFVDRLFATMQQYMTK